MGELIHVTFISLYSVDNLKHIVIIAPSISQIVEINAPIERGSKIQILLIANFMPLEAA